MQARISILIFIVGVLILSCKKEINIHTNWKETYAIYATLNLKDTAQYLRINRLFQSDENPFLYSGNPDSVIAAPAAFTVSLIALDENMTPVKTYFYQPSHDYVKDTGIFASEGYLVFKLNQQLLPKHAYRLNIKNEQTGWEASAKIRPLGGRNVDYSFNETRYFNAGTYPKEIITYGGSLLPNQFDRVIFRLLYEEYTTTDTTRKILDWWAYNNFTKSIAEDTSQNQFQDDFLRYIRDNLQSDPSIKRKAIGIDRLLLLNDELLEIYAEISQYGSHAHYQPDYTNFSNGLGIFASRYYYTFHAKKLYDDSYDSLAYGRFTKHLRFADAEGIWP
jgi:hypothetical protein